MSLMRVLAISQQGWKGEAFMQQCPFSNFPRCHERTGRQQLLDMTSKTLAWGFRWALPTFQFLALRDNWKSVLWTRLQREQLPMWLTSLCCGGSPPGAPPRIWPSIVPSFRNRSYPGWFLFLSLTLTDMKSYHLLHTSWFARQFIHLIPTPTLKTGRVTR